MQPREVMVGSWRCKQPQLCLCLLHVQCFPTRRSLKYKPPKTTFGQTDPANANENNKCVTKLQTNTSPAKLRFDKPIPHAQTKIQHVDKSVDKYQTHFDTPRVANAAAGGDGRELALTNIAFAFASLTVLVARMCL